jgi:hypothetical protein
MKKLVKIKKRINIKIGTIIKFKCSGKIVYCGYNLLKIKVIKGCINHKGLFCLLTLQDKIIKRYEGINNLDKKDYIEIFKYKFGVK